MSQPIFDQFQDIPDDLIDGLWDDDPAGEVS
jgi:hypothetical protein